MSHSLDFVDNTAAEFSADRGSGRAPGMRELVRRRFDELDSLGVYSAVRRITSADNDWADALSRGEDRVQDVLRMARALGWSPRRLSPDHSWRSLPSVSRSQSGAAEETTGPRPPRDDVVDELVPRSAAPSELQLETSRSSTP